MDPAIDYDLHDDVGFLVARLYKKLHEMFVHRLVEHGVNPPTWLILLALYQESASTPGELARNLEIDPGFVSRLVDRMETDGLVERRPGSDRRSISLELTSKGRDVTPRIAEIARTLNGEIVRCLTDKETRQLRSTIRKLLKEHGIAEFEDPDAPH